MNSHKLSFAAMGVLLWVVGGCQKAEPSEQTYEPAAALEAGTPQYQRVVRKHGLRCDYDCPKAKGAADCAKALKPIALGELLPHPEATLGHRVSVSGRLRAATAFSCTKKKCPDDACCNRCQVALTIADDDETVGRLRLDLQCSGNDARACCPVELGRDVVATGVLDDADGLVLAKTELCYR